MNPQRELIPFLPATAITAVAAFAAHKTGRRWWVWWLIVGTSIGLLNIGYGALAENGAAPNE